MSMPLLKPSRCVLLIGDDALYVYNVTGRGAKLVDTVPWAAEDFVDVVATLIRRECGGKPVLMLNDMTDQHFKGGQRLPKVGPMDRANVMQRRLVVAFPNYPLRGALPVKEMTRGGRPKAVSGGLYLFAAVPMSEPIQKSFGAVRESMASISGFALLPVEASDMVGTLAAKVAGKERKASKWAVFIGQHQSGALRQVIVRDGQLAMTRMTPVSDNDGNPNAWADEVAQEFKATVSYLSRFGYSADDGTDVLVIANEDAGEALEKRIGIPCNYASFTVQEAARLLGVSIGFQEDSRYADPLHVAWCGRKAKFILPMHAPELSSIHKPRQAVTAAMVLLVLGAGYLSWTLFGQVGAMMKTSGDLSDAQQKLRGVVADYESEVARMDSLGFDVKLVQGSINAYKSFDKNGLHALDIIKKVREALGDELHLDNFRMQRVAPNIAVGAPPQYDEQGNEIVPKAQLEATMRLSFPPTIEPDTGVREVINLERRLQGAFPGYTVKIDKQVADMTTDENFSGQAGRINKDELQTEDYFAVLSIKGDLP
jgi:hypothetical protein